MTVPTKARSRARTCTPPKPDKYGVRFYAVVGWNLLYAHSLWDSTSGNTMRSTPGQRYTDQFPVLRTCLYYTLASDEIEISVNSATALWLSISLRSYALQPAIDILFPTISTPAILLQRQFLLLPMVK
ncbi:hypothetical protein JG687_00006536 [Phytophthora cactorum]|uniref:Uncharacterized protein n=1 Tax=Phytophthora cactorum TaxID=29920 RepID=A0A8T1UML7_9STRA|nr:hypothetical protein JG687_00006536 [Phytophthora cactorum]